MPYTDVNREAAHKRYKAAQEVVKNNPDVRLSGALEEKRWNADWQPGDPTHEQVERNWDYYSELTDGGKKSVSQAVKDQEREQQERQKIAASPVSRAVDKASGDSSQDDRNASSVLASNSQLLTPEELDQQRQEIASEAIERQRQSLQPSVTADNSQNKSLDELRKEFEEWQSDLRQQNIESNERRDNEINQYNAGGGRDVAFTTLGNQSPDRRNNFDAEVNRRFFDPDGSMKDPFYWNVTGLTSQQRTPEPVRNIYDYYFDQEDRNGVRNSDAVSTKLTNEDQLGKVVRDNMIDDGADPGSRESMYMTGEQYLKYRNQLGIPGRDTEDINPDEIYSKADEMNDYGFVPYIVSDDGINRFNEDQTYSFVSNSFNKLADARRNAVDYTINYDGQQYSGRDFDKNARLWEQRNGGKKPELVYEKDQATDYAIPQAVVAYDNEGNRYVAPGAAQRIKEADGSIRWKFNDNPDDDWVFDDEDDLKSSVKVEPAKEGEWEAAWLNQEPLVLDSGQVIRADKARDILEHSENYADYGPLDMGRPAVNDPVKEGGWAPWFVDMVLSSAPYFHPVSAGLRGAGDTMTSASGMQQGYQDYLNNTYSLLSENPTREQQVTAATGSFLMPLTERLWGPLGEAMFKTGPTEKLLQMTPLPESVTNRTLPRWAMGASDEGIEEIAGNIAEEYQQNGLDWYSDDVYKRDKNGDILINPTTGEQLKETDSQGRVSKEDSNLATRLRNYIAEAPLAYLGGATLGGVLGAANIPEYYNTYKEMQRSGNYNLDDYNGASYSPNIDFDALMNTKDFTDEELEYYNR